MALVVAEIVVAEEVEAGDASPKLAAPELRRPNLSPAPLQRRNGESLGRYREEFAPFVEPVQSAARLSLLLQSPATKPPVFHDRR